MRESLFISVFPKTMVLTLLSVNIFTGHPSFMVARCAHKRLFLATICSSDSWDLLTCIHSLFLLHTLLRLHFLRDIIHLHYKISREKFEPEPEVQGSNPGSGSNFSLETLECKFPKAQIMSLFSINNLIWISYSCKRQS